MLSQSARMGALLSMVLALLVACGDDDATPVDGGHNHDAHVPDSGNMEDAAQAMDTGVDDASTLVDAGDASDDDGGELPDANVSVDSGDGDGAVNPASSLVTLVFEHTVNGQPVQLGDNQTFPYTNAAGNMFSVTRLMYFVSDLRVRLMDGTEVSVPGAHYVDIETSSTLQVALPTALAADVIDRVSFVMGLPPSLNVTGSMQNPPESLMEWPVMMGGGYHYMKFEGFYLNSDDEPFAFRTHSGGLHGTDYSFAVTLPGAGRTLQAGTDTVTIRMNLEQWFTSPNDWNLNDYFTAAHPGIMGNAAAQLSLQQNGASVFSLRAL